MLRQLHKRPGNDFPAESGTQCAAHILMFVARRFSLNTDFIVSYSVPVVCLWRALLARCVMNVWALECCCGPCSFPMLLVMPEALVSSQQSQIAHRHAALLEYRGRGYWLLFHIQIKKSARLWSILYYVLIRETDGGNRVSTARNNISYQICYNSQKKREMILVFSHFLTSYIYIYI